MNDQTKLDLTHAAMLADLDDTKARMDFYGTLADCEVFMLLTDEADADKINPEILDLEPDKYALVFDREDRLADFAKGPAPYAALPGRVIAGMLAGKKIGLGLNLGVAPSSILIPAEALDWLQQTLQTRPDHGEGLIKALHPAGNATVLIPALVQRLAGMGLGAVLAVAENSNGEKTPLLGVLNAAQTSQAAIAGAAQEALVFSSQGDMRLDVVFLSEGDALLANLIKVGNVLDLPEPQPDSEIIPAITPGSDPAKPPNLR